MFKGILAKSYFEFVQNGWLKSYLFRFCKDNKGNPLPLFSYPAIEYLDTLDMRESKILEIGSGYSTIFFAQRAKQIISFESNSKWSTEIQNSLIKFNLDHKVNIHFIDTPKRIDSSSKSFRKETTDNYVKKLKEEIELKDKKFEIIIVDGWGFHRAILSKYLIKFLSDGGIFILDNADQVPKAQKILKDLGFIQIQFKGYAPGGIRNVTSIYFKGNLNIDAHQNNLFKLSMFSNSNNKKWIEV